MNLVRLLALLPLICAASPAKTEAPAKALAGEPRLLGQIADARLKELSGLAASRRFPGWMWAHNDSGDSARLFLLDSKWHTRAIVKLPNAQAVDWEDIAVAGNAQDSTVTIADIGDNSRSREHITLYRFRERDLPLGPNFARLPLSPAREISVAASHLHLRYPEADSAQDAESLCTSADGSVLIVTKSTGPSRFYLARWPLGEKNGEQILRLAAQKQFGSTKPGQRSVSQRLVSAADVSPDGLRLAIVTYASLCIWKLPPKAWGTLDWKRVLESEPVVALLPKLPQCESAAWSGPSQVIVSSEGESAPLWSIPIAP